MIIEAIGRMVQYRWPDGEIRLIPGFPVNVDDERGAKILQRCGAKVRTFAVGDRVEFRSPLFGLCTGRVLGLEGESIEIGEHSLTDGSVHIPQAWIMRTLKEPNE